MTECVDCAFCAPLTDAERDQIFQALLEIVGPRGLVTAPDEIAATSLDLSLIHISEPTRPY